MEREEEGAGSGVDARGVGEVRVAIQLNSTQLNSQALVQCSARVFTVLVVLCSARGFTVLVVL